MVITLNPLLKFSAGQWNTLVNIGLALCGLAGQDCIGTNTSIPLDDWRKPFGDHFPKRPTWCEKCDARANETAHPVKGEGNDATTAQKGGE
ncbi:hypothetical protein [Acidovorax sp. 93]|uniref:hypothetical protein n=1 Tax=Acidovorax sp. 93 TaxID=2135632 RepID=UPI0011C4A09E|nr:hypothetical protein [Acidovorax sp. 93]